MYAIIETGGKQYRVQEGDIIDVDLLSVEDGGSLAFDKVMFLQKDGNPLVGVPFVPNCKVLAEYLEEVKGPKVIAFKYKKRKSSHRKVGHRQRYSRVKITEIQHTA